MLNFQKKRLKKDMRIFLCDDHAMLMEGIESLVNSEEGLEVCGKASNMAECLENLFSSKAEILVCDYNLPDGNGLEIVKKIKRQNLDIKIIMLSMHEEAHLVKEILKEGVDAYVLKKDSHKELLEAISNVKNGKTYLSSDINQILIQGLNAQEEQQLLTSREREVLSLIAKEYTNKRIAEELFISERTVETHRKNIFRKTGTNNLVGLIKYAYANNLI